MRGCYIRGGGDLGQPDRLSRMCLNKGLGTSNLLRRGGAPLARYRVSIIVWLPMQQIWMMILPDERRPLMAQRRVGSTSCWTTISIER